MMPASMAFMRLPVAVRLSRSLSSRMPRSDSLSNRAFIRMKLSASQLIVLSSSTISRMAAVTRASIFSFRTGFLSQVWWTAWLLQR